MRLGGGDDFGGEARAERAHLLQVPGIGPRAADLIIAARRERVLREPEQLRRLGVSMARALPFVLLNGRRPPLQEALFTARPDAGESERPATAV